MNNNTQFVKEALKKLVKLNYIKPGDIPNINLYMDQVTTFMDEHLQDGKRKPDDKILTKTMINNYTKNDLLPAPVKKKYSRDHLYILAFIYYFKSILSINDIKTILDPLTSQFFDTDKTSELDIIYKEVYNMCKSEVSSISKDISSKADKADNAFENFTDNDDDKEFLQFFALICTLIFDVYLKKNLIENLIDDYASRHPVTDAKNKKQAKKKQDKE